MGAACRVQVQGSCLVTVGRNLLQSAPHNRALPRLSSSSEPISPGATYSAKLFSAVTFSAKKFFAAFSGTRPGE